MSKITREDAEAFVRDLQSVCVNHGLTFEADVDGYVVVNGRGFDVLVAGELRHKSGFIVARKEEPDSQRHIELPNPEPLADSPQPPLTVTEGMIVHLSRPHKEWCNPTLGPCVCF